MYNIGDYIIYIYLIMIVLTIISIIVNINILRSLKKSTSKSILEGLEDGATTLSNILKKLKLESVTDVIELIKEIVTKDTGEKSNAPQNSLNAGKNDNT